MRHTKRKNNKKTDWNKKSDKTPEKALFNLEKQLRLYALNLADHHPFTKEFLSFVLSVMTYESQKQLLKYIYSCPRRTKKKQDHYEECLEAIATQDEEDEIGSILVKDIERLRININQDKFKDCIAKLIHKSNLKKGGMFNVKQKRVDVPF